MYCKMSRQKILKFDVIKTAERCTRKRAQHSKSDTEYNCTDENLSETSTKRLHLSIEDEVCKVLVALNRDSVEVLPGRETQMQNLYEILNDSLERKKSVSIYVSGCPGTGKTATVKLLLSFPKVKINFKSFYINCVGISTSTDLYKEIAGNFNKFKKNESMNTIISTLMKHTKPVLIVLDEIDELKTQTQNLLYSLFELPSKLPDGKIILIGIGNTLNFIDKCLPRLRCFNYEPLFLQFPTYTEHEIAEIISKRLKFVNTTRIFFSEATIKFLAAKVVSITGDIRNALGIASAALNRVIKRMDEDDRCIVKPQTIAEEINSIFDSGYHLKPKISTLDCSEGESFPLHQKLIICSLLVILKKNLIKSFQLDLIKVRDAYKDICQQRSIEPLSLTEFLHSCSLLEVAGVISMKKQNLASKVILRWNAAELFNILRDKTLFGNIINIAK